MASETLQLQSNAAYGRFPFDLFVLDFWHGNSPDLPADHQQRWNEIAWKYLSTPLLDRWPLYKRTLYSGVSHNAHLPSITEEQISEIFAPHQTVQERNLSVRFCFGFNIVWLRTCYMPELSEKYFEIEKAAGARVEMSCVPSPDHVLDDPSLFNFSGSDQEVLNLLLLRIPGLTDAHGVTDEYGDGSLLRYGSGMDDLEAIERAEEYEEFEHVRKVGLKVQNCVYVVDDEAVEKNMMKIWWFGEFGKILWDNFVVPSESDLDAMLSRIMDGQGFAELVGEDSMRGDEIRL